MKKGIRIIGITERGYQTIGISNDNIKNIISEKQLRELVTRNNFTIINDTEETINVYTVDIEEFDEGCDVNLSKWTIYSEDDEAYFSEVETKTYKRLSTAEKKKNEWLKKYEIL